MRGVRSRQVRQLRGRIDVCSMPCWGVHEQNGANTVRCVRGRPC